MAETLTQSEIDELLAAIKSGSHVDTEKIEDAAHTAKIYDFRTANKFSKEQMKTLKIIFDNFSAQLSNTLSGILRTMVTANVASIEEQTFDEFSNALPSPVILAILEMPPLKGHSLLQFSPSIAYGMINRILGGSAMLNFDNLSDRSFTEIEVVMIEKVTWKLLRILDSAWSKIVKISADIDRMETSSQFAKIVSNNEAVALITIEVDIAGETQGLINFCIPQLSIEPITKLLTTKSFFVTGTDEARVSNSDHMQLRLSDTMLELVAAFSDTGATIGEVLQLRVGDVLRLNHGIDEAIHVKVGGKVKFEGVLGVNHKKYAVKVTNIISEEEAESE